MIIGFPDEIALGVQVKIIPDKDEVTSSILVSPTAVDWVVVTSSQRGVVLSEFA